MRRIMIALTFICSFNVWANHTITISPGSEISLRPKEPVTVRCDGGGQWPKCYCEEDGIYFYLRQNIGPDESRTLKQFMWMADCYASMKKNPSC